MTPTELAAAHDENFVAAMVLLAELSPRGRQARHGPFQVAITGVPGAFFNATWALEPPARPKDLHAAVEDLRASGLPFVVHLRRDLAQQLPGVAELHLDDGGVLPCFAIEPGLIPPAPVELELRRVAPADWSSFLEVTAAGFGMPLPMVEGLYPPRMLEHPMVRAYLGRAQGRDVACGVSIRTGGTVGIYSIATLPDARGAGHGTAVTWHLLRDADPGWRAGVLQASEMGRPVYERMGFRLVREFNELIGRPG